MKLTDNTGGAGWTTLLDIIQQDVAVCINIPGVKQQEFQQTEKHHPSDDVSVNLL
jgi:hypothetical protein